MSKVQWCAGKPPAIGWWPASSSFVLTAWRWWNGSRWSAGVDAGTGAVGAARRCKVLMGQGELIRWRDWPDDMKHLPGYPLRKES